MWIKPNNLDLESEDALGIEEEKWSDEERENYYLYNLSKTLDLDIDEQTINILQKNYPNKTRKEIIESLYRQKDYGVVFYHQHEWISGELIKKYLLLDEYDSDVVKITIDTPEKHDCNLVELTPELCEKAYRWHRGDRSYASHLINREDYLWENKTSKLTIVGKWECELDEYWNKIWEPFFFIITSFRWDGSAQREPRYEWYQWNENDVDAMKYWMTHALIVEEHEIIHKLEELPPRLLVMEEWIEK